MQIQACLPGSEPARLTTPSGLQVQVVVGEAPAEKGQALPPGTPLCHMPPASEHHWSLWGVNCSWSGPDPHGGGVPGAEGPGEA